MLKPILTTAAAMILTASPVLAQSMDENVEHRMERRQKIHENWQDLSTEQQDEYRQRYEDNAQERRTQYQNNAPARRDAAREGWNNLSGEQQDQIKLRAQQRRESFGGAERRQQRRGIRRDMR